MNTELHLHRPALYNPALWSRQEAKDYYVARRGLLDRLVDDLRREQPGTRPQNRLILGLRGMGKSTLLRRLAIAVEDDAALHAQWLPLTFPEEQYNVASLADFWRNCLDALGDLLESRGDSVTVEKIDQAVEALDRKNADEVLRTLLQVTASMQRRLLLLVDNVDLILDRLKKEDWALREALQSHAEIMLIGASAKAMEATYEYGAAFYDFFKVDELRGLSEADMRETLLNLAKLRGAEEVIRHTIEQPGRLRVLHTLTGGNPRTAVLLYGVLLKGVDGDVRADLEGLLDEVTPLYKARFEELPPLAQQLMDKLALHWDPMSARQLADALSWDVNTVSAQLNRLIEVGVVEKVKAPGGAKRTWFQVGERFFNIWYLMRTSRRVRRKLVWLVEFLKVFYSADELRQAAKTRLKAGSVGDAQRDAEYALALSRALSHEPLARALETYALENLFSSPATCRIEDMLDLAGEDQDLAPKAERIKIIKDVQKKFPAALKAADVRFSIPKFVESLLGMGLGSQSLGNLVSILDRCDTRAFSELRALVMRAVRRQDERFGKKTAKALRQAFASGEMENDKDEEGANAAAERFSCPVLALLPKLSGAAMEKMEPSESERFARQAISLAPEGQVFWTILGNCLSEKGASQEAEAAYRKAISFDSADSTPWVGLGQFLEKDSSRVNEALDAYRRATQLEPERSTTWKALGYFLLSAKVSTDEETEGAFRTACALKPTDTDAWFGLAASLVPQKGKINESREAIEKALALDTATPILALSVLTAYLSDDVETIRRDMYRLLENASKEDEAIESVTNLLPLCVHLETGEQLLKWIDELSLADRFRPLREALAAAVAKDVSLLNAVAPEVRFPALEILKDIAPDLVGDTA